MPLVDEPSTATAAPLDGAILLDALLEQVAAGDRLAFARVYRLTSTKLYAVCTRILPVRQDAEEALQETYLSIWRRAITFDPDRGKAMTWLITLARNCAIDRRRATRPTEPLPAIFSDTTADPAPLAWETAERRESEARLLGCLDGLARDDARLIRTAFYEGSTYAELANRAATPLGTIKSRIRRALTKLAECLA